MVEPSDRTPAKPEALRDFALAETFPKPQKVEEPKPLGEMGGTGPKMG
jgi:hypothetical protein